MCFPSNLQSYRFTSFICFYGKQRLKADIFHALYKSTMEFAFYWSLSSCKIATLSFRVIAGNEGAAHYFLLLFESEKRVCCNEILFWGLRIKEIMAIFKRKRDRVSITRSQREKSRYFSSSRQRKNVLFSGYHREKQQERR